MFTLSEWVRLDVYQVPTIALVVIAVISIVINVLLPICLLQRTTSKGQQLNLY